MRPFYFKSYDIVIGVACNVAELQRELVRLAQENPAALEFHLREGHIVGWLESLNEVWLAEELKRVRTAEEARVWARKYLVGAKSTSAGRAIMRPARKKAYRITQ